MTLLYKALLKCAGDIKKSTDTHTETKFYDKSQQMKLAALCVCTYSEIKTFKKDGPISNKLTKNIHNVQCWEGYFGNVIGYRLQVTLLKM